MTNLIRNKTVVLFSIFFCVCLFLLLPFCRTGIITFASILLKKQLTASFWSKILCYFLISGASFSFFSILVVFLENYTKSENFNMGKTKLVVSLILFLVSVLAQCVILYNGIPYGADDSAYVSIARSMIDKNYLSVYTKEQYSIGYPLLLFLPYKIFGLNYYALKFANILLYSLFVVVLFNFLIDLVKDSLISFLTASFFCLNFTLVHWQNRTMSDTPCMVFSFFALVLAYQILFSKKNKKNVMAFLLDICFFFAYECRFNGMVCFITFFCMQALLLFSKIFPKVKLVSKLSQSFATSHIFTHILPYVIFAFSVFLQTLVLPNPPRVDTSLISFASPKVCLGRFTFTSVIYELFNSTWNEVFHQFNYLSKIALFFCIIIAIYGFIKNYQKLFMFLIFAFGISLIYCFWNGYQGIRFYFPLFIPLSVCFAVGTKSLAQNPNFINRHLWLSKVQKWTCILFLAFFSVSLFPVYTQNYKDNIAKNGHSFSPEAQEMWLYINENIPNNKMISFRSPRELFLYTRHSGIYGDLENSDYYLHSYEKPIDTELKNVLSDSIAAQDSFDFENIHFELEYQNEAFKLFKLESAPPSIF